MDSEKKKWVCPICRTDDVRHNQFEVHGCYSDSQPDEPLSVMVDCQMHYDDTIAVGRLLAMAFAEVKKHNPGKEFVILPHRSMFLKKNESNIILGQAYVASYLIVQVSDGKPDLAEIKALPIEEFFVPGSGGRSRIINGLRDSNTDLDPQWRYWPIRTVGELLNCTKFDILRRPTLGRKSLAIIEEALAAYGLRLRSG